MSPCYRPDKAQVHVYDKYIYHCTVCVCVSVGIATLTRQLRIERKINIYNYLKIHAAELGRFVWVWKIT